MSVNCLSGAMPPHRRSALAEITASVLASQPRARRELLA